MEEYYKKNLDLQNAFYAHLDSGAQHASPALRESIKELHNRQWSEHIHNIMSRDTQCPNDCKYCYMKTIRARFYGAPTAVGEQSVEFERVDKSWPRVHAYEVATKNGAETHYRTGTGHAQLIMFPSSHDIIPANVDAYIAAARHILEAGHCILLVSKARMDCIPRIDDALSEYRAQIIYRLTITTANEATMREWEPNAPPLAERMEVLKLLYSRGAITSVSIEPMLSDPSETVRLVSPYVNECVWIGEMSGPLAKSSTDIEDLVSDARLRALISSLRSDSSRSPNPQYDVMREINATGIRGTPLIMWKASIMKRICGC